MSFTSKTFFQRHAPDFNFELNEEQLVEKALERGFILHCGFRKPGGMLFRYNPDYKSVTAEDVNKVIRDNPDAANGSVVNPHNIMVQLQQLRDSELIPDGDKRRVPHWRELDYHPYHTLDHAIDALLVGQEAIRRVGLAREALALLDDRGPGGLPDFKGLRNKILEIIGGDDE